MQYIIAYDFGTTGVKTCLFCVDAEIRMEASAYAGYELYILETAAQSRTPTHGGTPCAGLRMPSFRRRPSGRSR